VLMQTARHEVNHVACMLCCLVQQQYTPAGCRALCCMFLYSLMHPGCSATEFSSMHAELQLAHLQHTAQS
jgi:hypothetical protein